MDEHRAIADRIAADIATGTLRSGDRLPTQRRLARDHRIAPSTAARVYAELARRGLVVGEVGRGTFVRASGSGAEPALTEPPRARVDLELNFPVLPGQPERMSGALAALVRREALGPALRPATAAGDAPARTAAADLLTRADWSPHPDAVLFAGGGRQAIAAAISALVPVGGRLGVEALTYPVVRGIAARLGVDLVPLPVDDDGLVPDGLRTAHRAAPLHAVYLQPALHNPLGATSSPGRRDELVDLLIELDLTAVEDGVYGFLRPGLTPLAAMAADRVLLVDSLSKRVAPGCTVGYLVVPPDRHPAAAAALRSGGWTAPALALHAATAWAQDGTAAELAAAKRTDAATRQQVVRERLGAFAVHADPVSYHCWWQLPARWRADTFVAAAARRGIAVTPGAAFAVGGAYAPNAVRLAISAPPVPTLADALDVLAGIAHGAPGDDGVE